MRQIADVILQLVDIGCIEDQQQALEKHELLCGGKRSQTTGIDTRTFMEDYL